MACWCSTKVVRKEAECDDSPLGGSYSRLMGVVVDDVGWRPPLCSNSGCTATETLEGLDVSLIGVVVVDQMAALVKVDAALGRG
eukprot:160668-Amphidinium_carterae.1